MTDDHYTLATYLHLARASELRRRWMVRDKLLLLCCQQAHALQLTALAEHCRVRILAHNPGHLIGHFDSVADAIGDERFESLVQQAERSYSGEKAEYMLQSLGIELGRAEATYATADEYLGSILGPPPLMEGDNSTTEAVADSGQTTVEPAPTAELDLDTEWPAPTPRRHTEAEITARERTELRLLLGGLVGLTVSLLAWSAFLGRH